MIDVLKQALEALEGWDNYGDWVWPETALEQCKRNTKESLAVLRQAIEQAELDRMHDRGAWSDVPDATKWVDELRGDEESAQEPVAWMYDFLNSDNRDEVIRNWVTQDIADIEREKGFNVRPLYAAPTVIPDVNQELVEALELYLAHASEPECAIWRHVQDKARAALNKHKEQA